MALLHNHSEWREDDEDRPCSPLAIHNDEPYLGPEPTGPKDLRERWRRNKIMRHYRRLRKLAWKKLLGRFQQRPNPLR